MNDARSTHTQSVVLERSFDAPPEVVWSMWTDPEHFAAWYGPAGAAITVAKMDVRVGGERLICMRMSGPGGPMAMWFGGEHREVVVNRRLAYSESMTDETGSTTGASDVTEVVVELTADGDRTAMVLTHHGIPAGSPGEMGWTMALEKLTAHVSALSR